MLPPTLAERFAAACETLVGIKFVEHGRDPSIGLDCAGAVMAGLSCVGVEPEDQAYALAPGADHWTRMVAVLESFADPVPPPWQRGDILGFRFGSLRNHLGVYLGNGLVFHSSYAPAIKKTVIIPLDAAHRRMVQTAWRLR